MLNTKSLLALGLFASLLIGGLSACVGGSVNGTTTDNTTDTASGTPVAFAQIQSIFAQRCNACHSTSPSYGGFSAPAGSLDFTQSAVIKSSASRIQREVVNSTSMPDRNNITGMTDAERALVGQWIEQGAKVE